MSSTHHKDPNRVAAGLKASIHNSKVSDEAKTRAHEKLDKLEGGNVEEQTKLPSGAMENDMEEEGVNNQVLGGYKATLHNPQVSEKAKANAKQVLDDYGASED
ncbi:hypothetical protein EST38_g8321 [Candolleomyces aberdarensis]|uniref:Conidiation protein 6 n=1 Tax=Candolleomyces aberdarensis TaxID=2316362 RepID=A0A4Q2DCY1_9AGAR|nr:hypothetical protein EST38_g8321 [Candolleomyces aberdarensis]